MTSWRNNVVIAFFRPKVTILDYCDHVSGSIVSELAPYMGDAWAKRHDVMTS